MSCLNAELLHVNHDNSPRSPTTVDDLVDDVLVSFLLLIYRDFKFFFFRSQFLIICRLSVVSKWNLCLNGGDH